MLVFIAFITTDYARCMYAMVVVNDGAHAGALYGTDPTTYKTTTGYADAPTAARSNATDLNVPVSGYSAAFPTATNGTDSNGKSYVEVSVNYTFSPLVNYPGIPTSVPLTRKIRMPVLPP